MLCLNRKPGERVALLLPDGQIIWVIFDGCNHHGRARLIFDAPPEVMIKREELLPEDRRRGRPQG